MPLPDRLTKAARDAEPPRPSQRKRTKVRLLVLYGDCLPPGVLDALKESPLEVLAVQPALEGLSLRKSDVVLLGDMGKLRELAETLKRLDAFATPVISIGDRYKWGANFGLRLTRLASDMEHSALSGAVLKAVIKYLKPLGEAKRARVSGQLAAVSGDDTPLPLSDTFHRPPVRDLHAEAALHRHHAVSKSPPRAAESSHPEEDRVTQTAAKLAPLPTFAITNAKPPVPPVAPQNPSADPLAAALGPKKKTAAIPPPAMQPVMGLPHPVLPVSMPLPKMAPPPNRSPDLPSPTHAMTSRAPEVGEVSLGTDPARSAQLSHSMMPESFSIQSSRWLVLDDNVARAHAAANSLIQKGAKVEVSGLGPHAKRLEALRAFDAVGVLVSEARWRELSSVISAFQRDPRLRWVRVVPVRWAELYDERTSRVDDETLKLLLLPHWQVEHDVVRDLMQSEKVPLETVGPAKLLRAAARLRGNIDFEVRHEGDDWLLTLGGGDLHRVVQNDRPLFGEEAVMSVLELLRLSSGTARTRRSQSAHETTPIRSLALILDQTGGPDIEAFNAAMLATAPSAAPENELGARPEGIPALFARVQDSPLGTRASALAVRGTVHLDRAANWFELKAFAPSRRAMGTLFQRWRPTLVHHKKMLAAGAGATLLTLGLAVALSSTSDAQAPEAVIDNAAAAPLAQVQVEAAPEKRTATTRAAPKPEPEVVQGLAVIDQNEKLARPNGCEKWVGSAPVARQSAQATSAWRMARKSLMMGDEEKAKQRLCLSVHLDPKGPGTLDLIRFYFMQGNVPAALLWARWAVQEDPESPEPKQLLADAMHQSGRESDARALLLESMNITAADVAVIKSVAAKYANAGKRALDAVDPAQADRLFRRATTLDDKSIIGTIGRARLALRHQRLEEAKTFGKRAVELDGHNFDAQLVLGDVYAAEGQGEEAKHAWLTAVALNPGSREARGRLGL